jgi:hypothetical protein
MIITSVLGSGLLEQESSQKQDAKTKNCTKYLGPTLGEQLLLDRPDS